ncbi:hypothetical protein RJ639_007352 [Escallonia herrerae]|uniref:Chlororespiratory reduction 21 n=1 Tax=Escallonia herrerae TaxID=1293975 RepID=A0AA88W368_9ASTE|nr:hypothetical protein RJ639_007352 [Escallonia herrerae]
MKNGALTLLLQQIRCPLGTIPDYEVFADTLRCCAAISDIKLGKGLHSHVVKLGHLSCQLVSKALLNMYAKCKALDDCRNLFGQMSHGDAVTWNILLSGFAVSRTHDTEVMRLFNAMNIIEDSKPTSITIAIILPVCTRSGALGAGKSVHSFAVKSGLESHTLVGNALISMYAKSGHVSEDAYSVFRGIAEKDVVSWNAMIAGLVENRYMQEAFELFCCMLHATTVPNYATIANILPVCAYLKEHFAYWLGKEIHCYALRRNDLVADISVINALVSFYLRIGRMREAESLFQRMRFKDMVSWNSIIAGYTSNGEWLKALKLFHEFISMEMVRPDSVTIFSILPACVHLKYLKVGKQIHGYVVRNPMLREDTAVGNALLAFYGKLSETEAAFRTFMSICTRDLISWNAMLDAFAENWDETEFVELLRSMFIEGIRPDSVTILTTVHFCATISRVDNVKETHCLAIKSGFFLVHSETKLGNALLDAYAKCGNMEYAFKIFESLAEKRNVVTCNSMISGFINCGSHDAAHSLFNRMSERDITTWNLMVRAYAENECAGQALSMFHELQSHAMKPDAVTVMSLLPVCAQIASVHLLRQCHGYVVRACFEDVRLMGALLDIYSRCGNISCAYKLFHSTLQKDLVMFTAMVGGYAMHGMGEEALEVFYHMLTLGVKPDHVIITAVLSACSHAGLVDEGLKIFDAIDKVQRVKPTMNQYACVVDLLARGGRIDDAYAFVKRMPIEADANVWGTLLGACRNYHEVELGRAVADHLFKVETNNIGNYVVMSNLYAANAKWDGVMEMRRLMRARDLKKPAGCSWVEVEGKKNVFIAGDSSHPQRTSIHSTLSVMDQQIKELQRF